MTLGKLMIRREHCPPLKNMACAYLATCRTPGFGGPILSVNLSPWSRTPGHTTSGREFGRQAIHVIPRIYPCLPARQHGERILWRELLGMAARRDTFLPKPQTPSRHSIPPRSILKRWVYPTLPASRGASSQSQFTSPVSSGCGPSSLPGISWPPSNTEANLCSTPWSLPRSART